MEIKESEPESSPRVRVDANATEPKINDPNKDQEKVSALLYNFAGYTTFHGFHFILESSSHIMRRIFWATSILVAMVVLGFQCVNGVNKLLEHDSVTVKEQQRGAKILLPAVTICNQNMLRKDKIMGTETQKFMDDVDFSLFGVFLNESSTQLTMESSRNRNETVNLDLDREVRRAGHNISEMLLLCLSQDRFCRPEDFYVFTSPGLVRKKVKYNRIGKEEN